MTRPTAHPAERVIFVVAIVVAFAALTWLDARVGRIEDRRPAPTVIPSPDLAEACNETGTFRVFVSAGTGIDAEPDPSCNTTGP